VAWSLLPVKRKLARSDFWTWKRVDWRAQRRIDWRGNQSRGSVEESLEREDKMENRGASVSVGGYLVVGLLSERVLLDELGVLKEGGLRGDQIRHESCTIQTMGVEFLDRLSVAKGERGGGREGIRRWLQWQDINWDGSPDMSPWEHETEMGGEEGRATHRSDLE
jgi:hypothetical protein